MIYLKNIFLIGTLSLFLIQNKTECVFAGFWNKLSDMTGYKFKKEQHNQSSQKSSQKEEHNLAIVPKSEKQEMVNVPASIGNNRTDTLENLDTINTNFKEENRDTIVMVLVEIADSDHSDHKVVNNLADIRISLGSQKALFLTQLIQKLAVKSNQNSAIVLAFINEQRKKYTIKDNHGNVDQTANFFKAFEDAKIVFCDLSPLKDKFFNQEIFTKKESTLLLKNIHLIDWMPNNSQIKVSKSYLEKLKSVIQHKGKGILKDFAQSGAIAFPFCMLILSGDPFLKSLKIFITALGVSVMVLFDGEVNNSTDLTKTITFSKDDKVVYNNSTSPK